MNAMLKANSKVITLGLVAFGLLFGGCAGDMNSASIDESSIQTKVFQPLTGNCDAGLETRAAGASGGKIIGDVGRASANMAGASGGKVIGPKLACEQQGVEVAGTCENCESVIANVGNEEFSVSVDENGNFSFIAPVGSSVQLTPIDMNGELMNEAVIKSL